MIEKKKIDSVKLGPEREIEFTEIGKGKINIFAELDAEKMEIRSASIQKVGQRTSALIWRGENPKGEWITNRNTAMALHQLGMKVRIREIDPSTPRETVIEICDQDNFGHREYSPEDMITIIEKRYLSVIMQNRQGRVADDGVKNVILYISGKTGLSRRTVARYVRVIKDRNEIQRTYQYSPLKDQERATAIKYLTEYIPLLDRVKELEEKMSEFTGGRKRLLEELSSEVKRSLKKTGKKKGAK